MSLGCGLLVPCTGRYVELTCGSELLSPLPVATLLLRCGVPVGRVLVVLRAGLLCDRLPWLGSATTPTLSTL